MARRKMFKIAIYSDTLRSLIAERTSIRKLGPAIGYSEKNYKKRFEGWRDVARSNR